jgi:dimeric dUTPase (all-alpha-NTP-PPase superfamily)
VLSNATRIIKITIEKIMKELYKAMLVLQNDFNKKVNPEWETLNYAWDTAIIVELAECQDHLSWKWWKHSEVNIDQVVLELVDIFHFALSFHMVENDLDIETCAEDLEYVYEFNSMIADEHLDDMKIFQDCIKMIMHDITDPYDATFDFSAFFTMWKVLGLNVEDLYKRYIGKNSLNVFRQKHGYKDGSYIKIWNGLEDNEVLTKLLNDLPCDDKLFDTILNQLESEYPKN